MQDSSDNVIGLDFPKRTNYRDLPRRIPTSTAATLLGGSEVSVLQEKNCSPTLNYNNTINMCTSSDIESEFINPPHPQKKTKPCIPNPLSSGIKLFKRWLQVTECQI